RLRFDRDHPLDPTAFAGITHVLVSVPPDDSGDPVFDRHRDDIAAIRGLAWLGYLSTTGVYGDRGGEWVDETSESRPTGERGARRSTMSAMTRRPAPRMSSPMPPGCSVFRRRRSCRSRPPSCLQWLAASMPTISASRTR